MTEYDENQEKLDFLIKKNGQPTTSVSMPQADIESWQGILPDRLLFL